MRLKTHLVAALAASTLAACMRAPQPVAAPPAAPQPAAAAAKTPPPAVGSMAPDFTLPAATRYGLLAKPASLSDYKGKTVVLAFFFRARTKG